MKTSRCCNVNAFDDSSRIVVPPEDGQAFVNPDGSVTYESGSLAGTDTFVYEVCDPSGLCDTATVTIFVGDGNGNPTPEDDEDFVKREALLTAVKNGENVPGITPLPTPSELVVDAQTERIATNPRSQANVIAAYERNKRILNGRWS